MRFDKVSMLGKAACLSMAPLIFCSNAWAQAIYVSNCGQEVFPEFPPLGGQITISLNCLPGSGALANQATLAESVNHSFHGHHGVFTGSFNDTFTSPAPWTEKGARLEVSLRGFASFQGNPGDVYHVEATLTGSFDGLSKSVSIHKTLMAGGAQQTFDVFDFVQVDGGNPRGPHISTLTITMSGPGQLHLERSGISEVSPVPEPEILAMLGIGTLLITWKRRSHLADFSSTLLRRRVDG